MVVQKQSISNLNIRSRTVGRLSFPNETVTLTQTDLGLGILFRATGGDVHWICPREPATLRLLSQEDHTANCLNTVTESEGLGDTLKWLYIHD